MNDGFNRVVLFGNLGADPELRKLPSGKNLLRLRLATNHSFLNRDGTREDRVEWHSVSMWGTRAEGLSRLLHKGSFLLVEGHIRSYSYEKDGQKRYGSEVLAHNVVLGGRCGPGGHDRDDADGAFADGDAAHDDVFDVPGMDASGDAEPLSPPRSPRPSEPFDTMEPVRPPRGGQGNGGAAPPPPPAPRKKTRSTGGAPAMAAA